MVTLTKPDDEGRLPLTPDLDEPIQVVVRWVDNGDGFDNNNDLDLRAGVLLPDGAMHWLAASHPGALDRPPFARHLGDVRLASQDSPGVEIIEIASDIATRLDGPVGIVFSVYSAMANGNVSIACLEPTMTISHGEEMVQCGLSSDDCVEDARIYTFVVGVVDVTEDAVAIRPSNLAAKPRQEDTPWLTRTPRGLVVSFDGTPVFKKGRGVLGRLMGIRKHKYVNV